MSKSRAKRSQRFATSRYAKSATARCGALWLVHRALVVPIHFVVARFLFVHFWVFIVPWTLLVTAILTLPAALFGLLARFSFGQPNPPRVKPKDTWQLYFFMKLSCRL